jgi:hypothetical protein
MEVTPRHDLVAAIAVAWYSSQALEQYNHNHQNNPTAVAATPVADPLLGCGDPDGRTAIGTNFSSSLEGMHALLWNACAVIGKERWLAKLAWTWEV